MPPGTSSFSSRLTGGRSSWRRGEGAGGEGGEGRGCYSPSATATAIGPSSTRSSRDIGRSGGAGVLLPSSPAYVGDKRDSRGEAKRLLFSGAAAAAAAEGRGERGALTAAAAGERGGRGGGVRAVTKTPSRTALPRSILEEERTVAGGAKRAKLAAGKHAKPDSSEKSCGAWNHAEEATTDKSVACGDNGDGSGGGGGNENGGKEDGWKGGARNKMEPRKREDGKNMVEDTIFLSSSTTAVVPVAAVAGSGGFIAGDGAAPQGKITGSLLPKKSSDFDCAVAGANDHPSDRNVAPVTAASTTTVVADYASGRFVRNGAEVSSTPIAGRGRITAAFASPSYFGDSPSLFVLGKKRVAAAHQRSKGCAGGGHRGNKRRGLCSEGERARCRKSGKPGTAASPTDAATPRGAPKLGAGTVGGGGSGSGGMPTPGNRGAGGGGAGSTVGRPPRSQPGLAPFTPQPPLPRKPPSEHASPVAAGGSIRVKRTAKRGGSLVPSEAHFLAGAGTGAGISSRSRVGDEEDNWVAIGTPRALYTSATSSVAVVTGGGGGGDSGGGDASTKCFERREEEIIAGGGFSYGASSGGGANSITEKLQPQRQLQRQHQRQHRQLELAVGTREILPSSPLPSSRSLSSSYQCQHLYAAGAGSVVGPIGGGSGAGGGGAKTTALDTIVTSFLRNQHERCPDPVCVLPPLSLSEPHRCPGRTPAGALGAGAPPNVAKRSLAWQVRYCCRRLSWWRWLWRLWWQWWLWRLFLSLVLGSAGGDTRVLAVVVFKYCCFSSRSYYFSCHCCIFSCQPGF